MSTRRVTLRDVAAAANVSVTSVSLYLNDKPGLAQTTRDRIASAISSLGYTPRGENKLSEPAFIGLLIERLPFSPYTDMFYGDVIQGIETQARSLGYNIALITVESGENLSHLLKQYNGMMCGVIVLGSGDIPERLLDEIDREEIPALLVDSENAIDCILPDYVAGAYEATQYLLERGHKNIAFIQGPAKYRSLTLRYHGYICALADAGIPLDLALVQPANSSGYPNKGYREMRALLDRGVSFDAVFCVTDRTALGALDALREAKISVPDEVAVIGFDNVYQSAHTSPPLTTVDVHKQRLGRTAVERIHQLISGSTRPEPIKSLLRTSLVVRESTR